MKPSKKQLANLRPPFTSDQDREKAAKNGKKGGEISADKRRKRKKLREELELLLESRVMFDGKERSRNEAISLAVIKRAMDGDPTAFKIIRETLGEDAPTEVNFNANIESGVSFGDLSKEQIAALLTDAKADK